MERPILFSTPMVQAILADIKGMTRRIIKFKFLPGYNPEWTGYTPVFEYGEFYLANSKGEPATKPVKCPYGQPGDTLWVRETWCNEWEDPEGWTGRYLYRADGIEVIHVDDATKSPWSPSIHMPRKAARLFLTVKGIRIERLWDISEEDAKAEGVEKRNECGRQCESCIKDGYECMKELSVKKKFSLLWNSLNAKRGYGWDSNPWVWVVKFERK